MDGNTYSTLRPSTSKRGIPLSQLYNNEPEMFINYPARVRIRGRPVGGRLPLINPPARL